MTRSFLTGRGCPLAPSLLTCCHAPFAPFLMVSYRQAATSAELQWFSRGECLSVASPQPASALYPGISKVYFSLFLAPLCLCSYRACHSFIPGVCPKVVPQRADATGRFVLKLACSPTLRCESMPQRIAEAEKQADSASYRPRGANSVSNRFVIFPPARQSLLVIANYML